MSPTGMIPGGSALLISRARVCFLLWLFGATLSYILWPAAWGSYLRDYHMQPHRFRSQRGRAKKKNVHIVQRATHHLPPTTATEAPAPASTTQKQEKQQRAHAQPVQPQAAQSKQKKALSPPPLSQPVLEMSIPI